MSSQSKSKARLNSESEINLIYNSYNQESANLNKAAALKYIKTLHENDVINPEELKELLYETEVAHKNWKNPPSSTSISKRILHCAWLKIAKLQVWLDAQEKHWKEKTLKWVFRASMLAVITAIVMHFIYGAGISLNYLVTITGLLLVAFSLLTPLKILQDVATLLGVLLVAWWYVNSLPGIFYPFNSVILMPSHAEQGIIVKIPYKKTEEGSEQDCFFDTKTAILMCNITIDHKPSVPKALP